jgi:hypothetical protein
MFNGTIVNAFVILVVLAAIYVKWTGEGAQTIFRQSDIYILAGALLALVVLRIFRRNRQNDENKKHSAKK